MNQELRELYEQDQAERQGPISPDLMERDRKRRQRVEELLDSGSVVSAEDYFHAAMVFQHGEKVEDYWKAYELARRAAEQGHTTGRWLAAAAYDRWLMKQGKPQKYGTQYTSRDDGPFILWDVDPSTTDEERAEWNVPPLAEAIRRAEEINQLHSKERENP
jgi:TPR repeat protein